MKKAWLLAAVGLLTMVFALGAIACGDDDDDGDNGGEPTTIATEPSGDATEPADDATEPAGEATEPADGGQPGGVTTFVVTDNPTLGPIVTTYDGYTVYTFDNDTSGTSTCIDACASTWPPFQTIGEPTGGEGVSDDLGTITRDDGITQVTYQGMPLYMYSGDPNAGDANGDGIDGTWHVVPGN